MGGAPARVDGRLGLLEGPQFPPGFDQRRIRVFNTNSATIALDALEREFALAWLYVRKQVEGRDAVQLERLYHHVSWELPTTFLEVPRTGPRGRFFPIKEPQDLERSRDGLRELGYVEGQTVILEPRWAEGRHDRLPDLVADLLRLKVDVIVAAATPASQAARAATSTVPIVIVAVADPVRAALVASLARPGGNVTGLTLLTPELSAKRVELLAAALGGQLPRLAVLKSLANMSHTVFLEETRAATGGMGVELQVLEVQDGGELEAAVEGASRGRAAGLIVFDDPVFWSHRSRIVAQAAARRLPVMYGYREFADEGGLMSYGPSRPDLYRRTATYVDRIFKGAKPGDLPVEQPTKFELVINLKTAQALGLTSPPSLLQRADQVIE